MSGWQAGDTCYFVESGRIIRSAQVIAVRGDFCTIRYDCGAIRLRASRLYRSEEDARATVAPRHVNPYMYDH